ncbi:hypothetical protein B4147_3890 [Bacillus wiedmannii]|uniref:Uncharacterized protein n=1 Tax=Bacillus wiedmannii TaxID=1890302 RepID=A0A0G8CJT7_9BACI|nr:hypothetical protein B4147_3890 [Bacillus wiedmannii]
MIFTITESFDGWYVLWRKIKKQLVAQLNVKRYKHIKKVKK